MRNWMIAALLSATCLGVVGCGNGLSRVEGQVTLDGQPLACGEDVSGTVCFYPSSGNTAPAVGRIDANGNYSITTGAQRGVAEGNYTVAVRASRFMEGDPNAPRPSKMITPRHYALPSKSGLEATVESGSNEIDFALVSKP